MRSWRLYLIILKVVACLASWRRGYMHFHHQLMSDNIDDIQDPRYHMSRRTFFNLNVGLHEPGWLYVLGMPLGELLAALNLQSTCHGPRPGPTLAPWYSGGLPACPGAESTRKDQRSEEKKNADVQEKHIVICISHSEDSREFIAKTVGAVLNPF